MRNPFPKMCEFPPSQQYFLIVYNIFLVKSNRNLFLYCGVGQRLTNFLKSHCSDGEITISPAKLGEGGLEVSQKISKPNVFFLGVYRLQPDECRPRDDMLLEKMYPLFSRFLSNHNPLALNFSGDMMILQVGVRTLGPPDPKRFSDFFFFQK